eukprot:CAMPEP_0172489382 /NCGR_PEP_ID=MMETSP1066-20121228/19326_1 /TAXON_ID=671091 /ORGANISM="Coscinodiscus wailesii, Strain CCMP2513" /LENGTH=149 /DNA_ID=CAMNT_0013257177 /DNA_START=366 /DNA_END=815 /DNA_ORIENTATION=-
MTARDWKRLLPTAYDRYSNGCNNEIVRAFGSTQDEMSINTLLPSSPDNVFNLNHEFDKITFRLSQCVIIMPNRCNESNIVLKHYFPWLGNHMDLCARKKNKGIVAEDLKENAAEAILEQNFMDELLFQFSEALFQAQLDIAIKHNASRN